MNDSWTRLARRSAVASALVLLGASDVTGVVRQRQPDPDPPAGAVRPFSTGEALSYRAVSSRFGTFGTGALKVERSSDVRGAEVVQLSFDFTGRVGPFRVRDETRSWIAAQGMTSLRYQKSEQSPLGSREERVEIYPAEGRWQDAEGLGGLTATAEPLDELSFLYYVRLLPLDDGESYTLTRHFDATRKPVVVRVLRREIVEVPAGRFPSVVVEMKVNDARVFGGNGTMTIFLTDDEDRIPVRLEMNARWIGSTHLVLEKAQLGHLARQ